MTAVSPESFAPHLSSTQVWDEVNAMPVTFQNFAEMTYYYNRLYDVLTGSNEGPAKWDELTVNECFRSSLWRKLAEVIADTEKIVGFNLSRRYHYEDIRFPDYGMFQTSWPGIASVAVKENWASIAEYGPFPISPIAQSSATVNNPMTQPIVLADSSIFENPLDIQMRNAATLNTYTPLKLAGYPKRVGSNWEIPIDVKLSSFDPAEDVDLQHRKYLILDIDPPDPLDVPTGAILYPVYPGTNQRIPEAKPRQTLVGGKIRYTFFIYTLVHPAFQYETVNLQAGEFYKLYPEIEFKLWSEIAAPAKVVWTKGGTEKLVDVTIKVVDPTTGVCHLVFGNDPLVDPCTLWPEEFGECCEQRTPETIRLRFYYKTDPVQLEKLYSAQITSLRQAITHRVAAELPVLDCGCRVAAGFIYENQQRFNRLTMKPFQGVEYRSSEYVELIGNLKYKSMMSTVYTIQRLVVL